MKPVEVLQEAWANQRLVRFGLKTNSTSRFTGYVVGISDTLALIHAKDSGHKVVLDGYMTIPLKNFRGARLLDDNQRFFERVFFLKGINPAPQPDLLLADIPGLISSANTLFRLIMVYAEKKYPGTCWVGRVVKTGDKSFELKMIDSSARWLDKTRTFKYKDITRVEFGSGYEEALWMVAEAERKAARLLDDL